MTVIEALVYKETAEDFAQIRIFRFVVKIKRADMVEISRELHREALA